MQRINEDIKTGQLKNVYLLYGEEAYLRRQYRDRLKNAIVGDDSMNYYYHEGKDVSAAEIIDLSETLPFFAERRLIVLENSGLFKSGGEELSEYLKTVPAASFFVFVEAETDKRSRLYKTVQSVGYAAEFAVQEEAVLKKWILGMIKKEGKNISGPALNHLLEKTGSNMENIYKETEKLFCYCMDKESIEIEDIDEICTRQLTGHIFDMVGAIAEKKQRKALELYYELLALKEPPMRILFLIARQFNLLLQVKVLRKKGFSNKAIGEKTGLPGFIAGKYAAQSAGFSEAELRGAVEACVEAEEAVKTGRINDNMSVELLIIRYSSES
jgi:DNA polymerase-3 subunit delta